LSKETLLLLHYKAEVFLKYILIFNEIDNKSHQLL